MDIIFPPFIELQNHFTKLSIDIIKGNFYPYARENDSKQFYNVGDLRPKIVLRTIIERYGPIFNRQRSGEYLDDLRRSEGYFIAETDSKNGNNPEEFFAVGDQMKEAFEDYYKKIEVTTHVNQEGITIVRHKNLLIDDSYLKSDFINDYILNEISSVFEQQKKCLERLIFYLKDKLPDKKEIKTSESKFLKIKWNGNINVLVDIFYRLYNEKKPDGKHFIETTPENLMEFIRSCFIDKDGKELSKETIETYLKPGKQEKRPSSDKQFDLDPSLNLQ